jgi:cell division protein FtsQ
MRHMKRLALPTRTKGNRRRPLQRLWMRRLRRIGVAMLALALVVGAGFAFLRSGVAERLAADLRRKAVAASVEAGFVVERVFSEGRSLADDAALTQTLQPHHNKPIFTVELEKLKQQVEALPWVRSASVGRRLPDTIWVRLEEHRPIARWMDGTRQVLVSDAQEVFKVKNAARYRELPLLFGKGAPTRSVELLQLVASEPDLARHVTGARLVGGRRWDVYLDGRIEVRLPANRPRAAWRRLAKEHQASGVITRAVTSIDLRSPDWLTLELPDAGLEQGEEPRA